MAASSGVSAFHLHRLFVAVAGETPKAYTLRLRLSRGAALLLTTSRSILTVALDCGFNNHESFTRAFTRRFGISPRAYRARGFATDVSARDSAAHAAIVQQVGPCVGLYHVRVDDRLERSDMAYQIVKKQFEPQPVLVMRRRVPRSAIAAAITEVLPQLFHYAQQHAIALVPSHPFTRYIEAGHGLLTIEPGIRIVGPRPPAAANAAKDGVIEDVLPGGPVVTTVHAGPYETLVDAYAAIESWMETQKLAAAGAPWESYITDPGEHPDPKDWTPEVAWPISG
jgi:AraC family transcriptional regulator